ncbi:2-polyprenyl-6-methoxyphenol hydroxylase [Micromonospora coriariae]|uniref:2-polyprenyl-6-methoxyphenol hydroxylase n=1 Tax=Micromonospora coriariae TaxID=285665 RepID=A0A1C4XWQ9_9ACTN|nr:FAD-dependent monooxygenase [Micromonospora coriariae]SCF12541.1 2-polyprenyl-6-methoxyphenol hydroxylase [Micromonospora coriariae]
MTSGVVIVGAGPAGLLLAAELQLAGVPTTVLDQRAEPDTTPRANGLVGRIIQALHLRGLHEPLAGQPDTPRPTPWYQFGGLPLDLTTLPDNPLYTLPVPQHRIEQVLHDRASALGADIRRDHRLTALHQTHDRVTLHVHTPTGEHQLTTRWLIGADGAHSTVRRETGIPFPGHTDHRFVSHIGHAHLPADRLNPDGTLTLPDGGRAHPFTHHRLPDGVLTFARLPGAATDAHLIATMEWTSHHNDHHNPPTQDDLQHAVDRVLGGHLPLRPPGTPTPPTRRLTGVNLRQATTYRHGRVLLLGDAAHVYPAVGGPGLNLGLNDALNLGWKLAAQVHDTAAPDLLDSYQAERAPVARRVALQTRAQLALLAPGDDVTALRDLLTDLLDSDRTRRDVAALLAGADHPYDMGSTHPHPLTGAWLPDLLPRLTDGADAVRDALRRARGVLIDLTSGGVPLPPAWQDRLDVVPARGHLDARALLVRPDGYLAWAGATTGDLTEALRRWFGPEEAAAITP